MSHPDTEATPAASPLASPLGRRRLRFAVIADTHVNPSDDDNISPFESHRLTNARLRHTVQVLNGFAPDMVMHVGDIVHPVPEAHTYGAAAAMFHSAVAGLEAPLYFVPGNHDIGDKCAPYVPAGAIREDYVALYQRHFGDDFHAFEAAGCQFIVINTSLINSGLPREREQAEWLQARLDAAAGQRCFMFMHYPPFIRAEDEPGHYDNIDEPGRGWLLDLLSRHAVEAAFTGHVHNFFFNRAGTTPIYSLPSTAFVRGDYAELFGVTQPAQHENGRNDTAKLAIAIVDVFDERTVTQLIRTHAHRDAALAPVAQRDWPQLPPAAGAPAALGIDLRYSWTEAHDIPYSSMLDEFARKRARNDYPVLALWELGIGRLRVPLDDLMDEGIAERMAALAQQGARFTVFVFGWPSERALQRLAQHRAMLRAIEVVLRWPLGAETAERVQALRQASGLAVHLSRFWSAEGGSRDGKQIKLLVDHGFVGDEAALGDLARAGVAADALVFRVPRRVPAAQGIAASVAAAREQGTRAQVHVRLADDSPAVSHPDPLATEARALEAAFSAHLHPGADVFIDTLSDVDRGYFPRAGLVDRLFNPREGSRSLRNLHGALARLGPLRASGAVAGAVAGCSGAAGDWALHLMPGGAEGVPAPRWAEGARALCLRTGEETQALRDAASGPWLLMLKAEAN